MSNLEHMKCPICGIFYGVDSDVMAYKSRAPESDSDRSWRCPNGHELVSSKSEADEQRRRAERAEQQAARLRDERDAAERSVSAHKGQITKLKNRAKAGVCSCCNRTFENLARHMKTKHPNMDPKEPLKVIAGGKAG